ncbi:hypothetical protein NIES3974_02270 [Calothrix sp. NIES-3974]|nr:hypothetical protein NIES3974_02270 [Calothrix sp. NIES-3974]
MRIFLSCQQARKKHNIPAYSFWETYLKKGIEEAGYEWVEAPDVDWAEALSYYHPDDLHKWRQRTWNCVLSSIKQQHQNQGIDLFLGYLFPKQIEIGAVEEIRSLGIPCVNFFCDNVREYIKVPKEFYCFDLHWVPEFKALKMYQQAQLNYIYAPMPVWISKELRTCEHRENYGVSFIGSRDIQRAALLAQVINSGIALEIRGAAWSSDSHISQNFNLPSQNIWQTAVNQLKYLKTEGIIPWLRKIQAKSQPTIPDEVFADCVKKQPNGQEYTAIIQQSTISLGINRYPSYRYPFSYPNTYSRMRDIEAPMMGACYLTEWTEGLDDLYELGEEIETFSNAEEMIEKIRMLQADPKKRKKMRCQAQKRALTEHSVANSINKICITLGLHK